MTMRAAIYARISEDRTGQQTGVSRQLEDCRERATDRGWEIVAEYTDNDLSAYSGKPRPEYRRMLADIAAGAFDVLIAWHPDRLHRRPIELEEFIEVVEAAHCQVETVRAGHFDLATPSGRLVARLLGDAARYESEHKSDRARRQHLQLAQRGRPTGGPRAYGFTSGREIIPEEAEVIREASRRLLAGESLRTVATDFNRRGIPTARRSAWSGQTLKQIITNPRNAGLRALHGEVIAPATWDAILDEQQFHRLHALLTDPGRRLNRTARRYLLAGMLECHLCGAKLITRPSAGRPGYACATGPGLAGCGHLAFLAEPLHDFITEAVLQRLDTPELARAIRQQPTSDGEIGELEVEIAADTAQLEQLSTMYGLRQISAGEYLNARKLIGDRLALNQAKLGRLVQRNPLRSLVGTGGELRKRWPDLNLDQRRAIVRAVLDRVIVHPAIRGLNRFQPGRFAPVWRV